MTTGTERWNWLFRALALAAACAALRGLADGPAASAPAPADPSIEAAKKDFTALKRPDANLDDKMDLPRIDVPTIDSSLYTGLPSTNASRTASSSSQKAGSQRGQKDGPKSADWLLRAMDKEARRDGASGRDADKDLQLTSLAGDEDAELGESAVDASKEKAADARKPESAELGGNPLTAFMAQWLSSKTPSILSARETGGPADGAAPISAVPQESALPGGIEALPSIGDFAPLSQSLESAASDRPGANPYLAALEAPLTAVAAPAPASASYSELAPEPAFRAGPQSQPAPSLSEPGAASGIPDFARPSDDDKYFPQLKRF